MVMLDRVRDGYRSVIWEASAESNPVELQGGSVWSISLPAGFTSATLGVLVEEVGGAYVALHVGAVAVSIAVTAGARNVIPVELLSIGGRVKFVATAPQTLTGLLYPVR